jgi:hypothetical protein
MTLDEAREFGVYLMALAALAEPHGTRAYLLALTQRDTAQRGRRSGRDDGPSRRRAARRRGARC